MPIGTVVLPVRMRARLLPSARRKRRRLRDMDEALLHYGRVLIERVLTGFACGFGMMTALWWIVS